VIAVNYLATDAVIDRFGVTGPSWIVVTSMNALALLAALVGCLTAAVAARPPATTGVAARGGSTAAA
jgi:hypothetical protein